MTIQIKQLSQGENTLTYFFVAYTDRYKDRQTDFGWVIPVQFTDINNFLYILTNKNYKGLTEDVRALEYCCVVPC